MNTLQKPSPPKAALLGFGTVGSCFFQLAQSCPELQISTVLSRRPRPGLKCAVTSDFQTILSDPSIQIVVEAMGGLHPAYEYVRSALEAGKHVVTPNKLLIITYYDELRQLALRSGVCLRFTGAAGGGIPWLTALSRAARLDQITAVEGILNDTTNYILIEMSRQGISYQQALEQAQAQGIAEADPTADVEGLDALRKLALTANIGFGVSIQADDIPCLGISSISAKDISYFQANHLCCKLFACARRTGDQLSAFVMPTLFPTDAFQVFTTLSYYARQFGRQSFSGYGTGPKPSGTATGSAVLGDCLDILDGCHPFYHITAPASCSICNGSVTSRFYFRTGSTVTITPPMTVSDAFSRIQALKQEQPDAFFARLYEDSPLPIS